MESRESPVGHVRNALALLTFARARAAELSIPPDAELLDLLDGARGRLWAATNELEAVDRPALPAWWWRLHRLARRAGWRAGLASSNPPLEVS